MTTKTRRSVLQGGAALTGTLALGFPAIVRAQTDKIKIGHLTPLTGFLGALGAYAQLGIRMAEEEINKCWRSHGTPDRDHLGRLRSIRRPAQPKRSACSIRTAWPS